MHTGRYGAAVPGVVRVGTLAVEFMLATPIGPTSLLPFDCCALVFLWRAACGFRALRVPRTCDRRVYQGKKKKKDEIVVVRN
jgi:hypothetical protein